ncbi:hypothetical protein NC653_028065 [Populus alba x Populus x berolinensis]|uniref:Uncharacterized protein n=1 Tax=Populus alba x Populus x berolinensis TaxID=444605 RepID=A0AAD6M744_9ROSI|nr:hypothetical protein NC653_028065 [Populus alba x Populus x berolinensis]
MGSYDDIKKQQNHGGRRDAFFPAKYIEEREVDGALSINLPGLLIVDIAAVDLDSNKRLRAWLSCDLPVLVLDIAAGVDHEVIELVKLLRLFRKDFVLVLNKVFFFFFFFFFFCKKGFALILDPLIVFFLSRNYAGGQAFRMEKLPQHSYFKGSTPAEDRGAI